MKVYSKVLALFLALTMCIGLAACGEKKIDQGNSDATVNFSLGLTTDGKYDGYNVNDYVTLGSYTDLILPASVTDVTDESVQDKINSIMTAHPDVTKITDRAVKDGDTVNIDYTGYVDGKAFDKGSTNGAGTDVTIGTTNYIDGFLDQLVGHKPGETFDIKVTFPDNYSMDASLSNKEATFNVTINYISETKDSVLTDDFVVNQLQSEYGYTSVADMKTKIAADLLNTQISSFVWDTAYAECTFKDVPDVLVQNEFTIALGQLNAYATSYGTDLATMLNYQYGVKDEDTFRSQYKDQMAQQVKYYMMVQAIAEKNGLLASEDDVKTYFKDKTGSDDYSQYVKSYGYGYIYRAVTMNKVNDFLIAHNSGSLPATSTSK